MNTPTVGLPADKVSDPEFGEKDQSRAARVLQRLQGAAEMDHSITFEGHEACELVAMLSSREYLGIVAARPECKANEFAQYFHLP